LRKVFSAEEKPDSRLDGLNFTFYSSKKIEENYRKAESTSSLRKQKKFLKEVYNEVNEQALLVPLGYNYVYYYATSRLKNYKPPLFWETSFLNVENWELE
jgi:ABC-type transport system substrate-binding protein